MTERTLVRYRPAATGWWVAAENGAVAVLAPAVSAGTASSMALLGDGTVRAWGNNAFGQVGDGTRADSAVPVPVKGMGGQGSLPRITAIAAGRYYAAALDADGVRRRSVAGIGDSGRGPVRRRHGRRGRE